MHLPPQAHPGYSPAVEDLLFGYFASYVESNFSAEVSSYKDQVSTMDLRSPHTWYPFARALKRKIIYHAGAVNGYGYAGILQGGWPI